MTDLILHCGAQSATLDQIAAIETPPATRSWKPIAHVKVIEAVEETLAGTAFAVERRQFGLARCGHQMFGTLDLRAEIGSGVAVSIGIRNSTDKTFPMGFLAGNRVFVCDNLSFSAELMVTRKHTVNGAMRFREDIALSAGKLAQFQLAEAARVVEMQTLQLDDQRAESIILRAWEKRIVSHRVLADVLTQWRTPSFDDFEQRTAWSLFNAFTEALKPVSESNPASFADRTLRLNRLFFPAAEPDVIDAAAELIGVSNAD